MSAHELKKFVVDGNAASHERRLGILRTFTWNLPNPKFTKKVVKRTTSLINHIEVAFQKQVAMCDAADQDILEYEEQSVEMDNLVAQKRAELAALQAKWREINAERINQEKREALAQVITSLPSREDSQAVMDEIKEQQKEFDEREAVLNNKMEARRELLYPLGINLALVFAEFKEDIQARQKRLLELKGQKDKADNDRKTENSQEPPDTSSFA